MDLLGINKLNVEIDATMKVEKPNLQQEQLYDNYNDNHVYVSGEDLLQKRSVEQDSCPTDVASLRSGVTTLPLLQALTDSLHRKNLSKMPGNFTQRLADIFKMFGCPKSSTSTVQFVITFILIASQILAANSTPDTGQTPTVAPISYLPTPGSLGRLQGGAETVSNRKTTQQKRELPLFMSDHNGVQCLMTKYQHVVEIRPNGKVKGTFVPGAYSLMKFSSISTGFVAIQGNATGRYLAMDNKGKLVGLKTYVASACNFYEAAVENNYYVYYQERTFTKRKRTIKRVYYVGFDNKGRPRPGKKVRKNSKMAHFLKLPGKRILLRQGALPGGSPRRRKRPRRPGKYRTRKPKSRIRSRKPLGKGRRAGRRRRIKTRRPGSVVRKTSRAQT